MLTQSLLVQDDIALIHFATIMDFDMPNNSMRKSWWIQGTEVKVAQHAGWGASNATKPGRTAANVQQPTGHALDIANQYLRCQDSLLTWVSRFLHLNVDFVQKGKAYQSTSTDVLHLSVCVKLTQNQALLEHGPTVTQLP
jgi:hypothetical protein